MVPSARLDQFSQVPGTRKNWNLGAYIHVLVVAVAQTCETSAWVSVVCHTQEKYERWKTGNGNGSMLTASWLPSHKIVGNTCTVALTRLHPFKSSARATVLVLAITQCLHSTTSEPCEFWYTIKRWKGSAAMPIKLLSIQLGDLMFPCTFQMCSWLLIRK